MSGPLTDLVIRKLTPAADQRLEVWDTRLPGFGLRASGTGCKSFILVYRYKGRPRRMTLGRYPLLSLAKARKSAIKALGELAGGADPQVRKTASQAGLRFDELVDQFVHTYCKQHNRLSTRRETERLLKARFVSRWRARDVREIGKVDILSIVDGAVEDGAPSAANHALATVRVFFTWCVDRGILETNPCAGLKMPAKKVAREHVLDDGEVGRIWVAAGLMGYPFGTLTQLLLLTAQRRNEVTTMCWADLDLVEAKWSMPGRVTKNGVMHVVPLVPEVVEILTRVPKLDDVLLFPARTGEGRTFTAFSKGKERLMRRAGIEHFTLHDLRRTVATRMASLGVAPHVVERLLNHVTGILGGVAGVYNRYKYHDEVRAALSLWAAHVQQLAAASIIRSGDSRAKCPATISSPTNL